MWIHVAASPIFFLLEIAFCTFWVAWKILRFSIFFFRFEKQSEIPLDNEIYIDYTKDTQDAFSEHKILRYDHFTQFTAFVGMI